MKKSINQSTMVITINALSIIFIIATVISFMNVRSIGDLVDQASIDRFELTFNANRFMDGSAYLTNEVRAFAATGDIVHYNNYWNEINVLKNRDIGVERLKEIGITQEEQAKIDAMAALSNNLVPLESDAMDMTMAGKMEDAIEAVYGESYERTIREIRGIKNEFLTMLDNRAARHVDELNEQYYRAETIAVIMIAIVGVLQIANAMIMILSTILPVRKVQKEMEEIARGNLASDFSLQPNTSEIGRLVNSIIILKSNLNKYVSDISEKLEHMSQGDMNLSIDIDYIGDFAPIKSALNIILASLNETLSQINQASNQVHTASKQIADGAQTLAQGSTEQSSSIQQLSASITEIAQKTNDNAEMAGRAAALANNIMDSAEKGSNQMNEMMEAVNEINQASQNINKVIKVIDDIAFQTNILALNAAVEAARAGVHGKGFAVVAEEVRNLAAKSSEAAKDTGGLIANSIEKAELGSRIAGETAASLAEIVTGINESNLIVNEIARSSGEQSVGISQINSGIEQVAIVVHQNSATAEQSAAASQQMSGQASILEELISHFNLRNGNIGRMSLPPVGSSDKDGNSEVFTSSVGMGKY
ncbi:MAG: methyl-accepting chemotaxis protein [Oscillospiraceae bacterium]|nr:methyl-accepting chemotaxis protein [Oscillospiraceae bacterium]